MAKYKNHLGLDPISMYGMLLQGKLKSFPNNYLDQESIKVMVRHLILTLNGYNRQDVLTKVNHAFLEANCLGGTKKFFNKSDITMLIYCFPEWDLKAWEFIKTPQNFWKSKDNQRAFVLWVANKEGISLENKNDYRKITVAVIFKYGGSKAMRHAGGLFELLNTVACDKYKKWEITRVFPWHEDEIVPAIKWLVEEKLQYTTPEQACRLTRKDFADNNLDGLLERIGQRSVLAALELAYPGVYCRHGRQGITVNK